MTYETKSGDSFDWIAHKMLGDSRYMEEVINANRDKVSEIIFSAGVKVEIPAKSKLVSKLVPIWRR